MIKFVGCGDLVIPVEEEVKFVSLEVEISCHSYPQGNGGLKSVGLAIF